jgi:hypothetical protein
MGHLNHGEKKAGRNDTSANWMRRRKKFFQARHPSKMRPGVRFIMPWLLVVWPGEKKRVRRL